MTPAFVAPNPLSLSRPRTPKALTSSPRMSESSMDTDAVVNKYFPLYQRSRAPLISIDGSQGVSVSMAPVVAFTETDKTDPLLFSYDDPDSFVPNKPVPPSDISWPSGDGRSTLIKGSRGSFNQANLKFYGPFPDFFKRSCDR
eukprot:GFKZ01008383.1.p1 GENE.GFKZ01008383.1~~GFKZ01008383.1.p1  ORF type:complete len:143 (-),score=4.97 GFKZ01008383.1:1389-1817(-)